MSDWLQQRNPSERLLILVAGVLLILLLFYLIVLRPLSQANLQLNDEIEQKQASLQWMQANAAEVKRLQSAKAGAPVSDERSLIARVTAELRTADIVPTSMQPVGENRLRVNLDKVVFTKLMERLDLLQNQYGVAVSQASFSPDKQAAGYVSARLTLAR